MIPCTQLMIYRQRPLFSWVGKAAGVRVRIVDTGSAHASGNFWGNASEPSASSFKDSIANAHSAACSFRNRVSVRRIVPENIACRNTDPRRSCPNLAIRVHESLSKVGVRPIRILCWSRVSGTLGKVSQAVRVSGSDIASIATSNGQLN